MWITQSIVYRNLYLLLGGILPSVIFPAMAYAVFAMNFGFVGAKAMIQYLACTILRRTAPPIMVDEQVIQRARKIRRWLVVGFILVVTGLILIVAVVGILSNGGSSGDSSYMRNMSLYQRNDTFGISFGELTGNYPMADLQPQNGQTIDVKYTSGVTRGDLTIQIEDDNGKVRWRKTVYSLDSGSIHLSSRYGNPYHLLINGNGTKGKVDFKCSDADVTVLGLNDGSGDSIG